MLRRPGLRIGLVVVLALVIGGARGSGVASADPAGNVYRACGWEVTIGGEGSPPCMSLPDAIAAAAAHYGPDTIEMYPGSYCPITLDGSDGAITFAGIGTAGLSAGDGVPTEETGYESQLTSFAYSEVFCGSPPNTGIMVYVHNDASPINFENLTIEGSGDYSVQTGLQVESAEVNLRDVLVENFPGKGIIYGDSCYNGCYGEGFTMVNSASIDNGQDGFLGDDAEIANSTIAGNGGDGVSLAGFFELYNDTITGNAYGFDAYLGSYEASIEVWDTVVAGNTLGDCTSNGGESGYYGWETAYSGYNLVGLNAQDQLSCPDRSGTDGTFDTADYTPPAPAGNGGPTPSVQLPGTQWEGTGQNCVESTDQREYLRGSECDVGSLAAGITSVPNLTASSGDLGQVDTGQTTDLRVTFGNSGGDLVGVSGPGISGDGYSIADENCTYSLLEPAYYSYTDLTCSVDVSVTPNADGTWDGTLTLSTTAGDVNVPLHAQAVTRPVGVDDEYNVDGASLTGGGFQVAAPGVLANDPAGTTVDEVVSQPSNGTLTGPNSDGSFSYLPDVGFTGDDSFQYTIVGGDGIESHPITVTLHVLTARPAPPVFVNAAWAGLTDGTQVTASDGNTHTIGTDAFATLDDGLNAAAPAAVVNVAAGKYDESDGWLELSTPGVQLVGAGPSTTHVVDLDQLYIDAPNVTIQGIDFSGSGVWNPSTITYTGSSDPLLYIDGEYGATGVTVKTCHFEKAWQAIYVAGSGGGDESYGNDDDVIQANVITHVVDGIELDGAVDSSIVGNNIHDTGNNARGGSGTAQAAILLNPYSDGTTVSSNVIANSGNIGISIRSSLNVVQANKISNSGTTYPTFKEPGAIEVVGNGDENPSLNQINWNTITTSAFAGIKLGYEVEFTNITHNTISGTLHGGANGGLGDTGAGGSGILIDVNGAAGTDLFRNTLSQNTGWGILQEDSGGDSWGSWADHNDFLGNLLGGLENLDSYAGGFSATNNYWGDASGPSGDGPGSGQSVSGATFNPWLGCNEASTSCPVLNTAKPTVSDPAPVVGELLTGSIGSWSGTTPITTVTHWLQCDANGANCTTLSTGHTSYRVQTSDIGYRLEYEVERSNTWGDVTVASDPTQRVAPVPPTNDPSSPPSVNGSAVAGQVLSGSVGSWTGTAPITTTERWVQCDANGQNCNGTPLLTGRLSYRVQPTDIGHTIRFEVEKSNPWGDDVVVDSAPTLEVAGAPPANNPASPPTVSSSTAVVGQTLTGSPGSWSGTVPFTTTVRWRQCDANGVNCTTLLTGRTSYRVQPTDAGHTIEYEVEKSSVWGDVTVDSAPTQVT